MEFFISMSETIKYNDDDHKTVFLKTLNEQRLEGEFCDIAIVVEDVKFRAHSIQLSNHSITQTTYFSWKNIRTRLRGGGGWTWTRWGAGEKSGNDQEEARLQNASKQIVCTAIQQAVRQLSQESQTEEKATSSSVSLQLERRQSTKKHEKK
ncbi:uncharacterized protein LOC110079430 isoform X4 [Pogona vitticeps]|nr:uncharacterized protein LOC110079430 isoform X2 [Pogona vitticeps]